MKKIFGYLALFAFSACTTSQQPRVATVAIESQCNLGEGTTWIPQTGKMLWVDIEGCKVHEWQVAGNGTHIVHQLPARVSTIAPYNNDTVILALQGSIVRYDLASHAITDTVCDFSSQRPTHRPNDGKCSPDGRLFVGLMPMDNSGATGALYRVDGKDSITLVVPSQTIPNGIAWNNAGNKMYYIDTPRMCVEEYDYDATNGNITLNRVVVSLAGKGIGGPDGMTIDDQDRLWIAHWGGACVGIWDTQTGEMVDKIDVPALHVSNCTFGGVDNDRLYISTAQSGLSEEQLKQYPLSGNLFEVKLPAPIKRKNSHSFTFK